jgi:hypothetical protein
MDAPLEGDTIALIHCLFDKYVVVLDDSLDLAERGRGDEDWAASGDARLAHHRAGP